MGTEASPDELSAARQHPSSHAPPPGVAVKHALDRVAAVALLLVLSPVLLLLALSVALTSRGAVLYVQERVGRHGVPFQLVKFRSMVVGADRLLPDLLQEHDRAGSPLFKVPDDPRVTGLGRWLRRTSLDELPQLWNIARGEMSFVGPRPQRPAEVFLYERAHHQRLAVRPGLTGLWQVSGRSDVSWEDAVRMDLHYVDRWSLALDLQILVRTIPAVIRSEGAA